ncbi:MAG: hypothetical protein WCA46_22235 [Actinocatenispora sp.]
MRTHSPLRLRAGTALAAALVTLTVPVAANAVPGTFETGTSGAQTWTTSLAHPSGQEVNARHQDGALRMREADRAPASVGTHHGYATAILAAHKLSNPANRVDATAKVSGGGVVTVDIRGLGSDGAWTAWQPARHSAPAVFDRQVDRVQARVTMTATHSSPVVRSVRFVADHTSAAPARPALAVGAHVFATREGLVGGTTANGHVITENDHFVALPSGRALSPRDTTDLSVHICNPANGACVDAPVWDIGPWNTHDDYWSPAGQRENWGDLPQGTPEAQAAYNDGYNGGLDQFGRSVLNPAGIDLADGTFADLGMGDNGYVDVTYLWT